MGFWSNEVKKELAAKPKRGGAKRNDIPIASLNQMGCKVCPRDKEAVDMRTPKMEAQGPSNASLYLLGSFPTEDCDAEGMHWSDKAGNAIYKKFYSQFFDSDVRSNYITQCIPPAGTTELGQVEIECCRNRIIADIENTKPLVVVGIGDQVLDWATGLGRNTPAFRGTLIAAKFGKHVCWYYPVLYPNFVFKKSYGTSEYELALEHDIENIVDAIENEELPECHYADAPYDSGIEYITGSEPGDIDKLERALHQLALLPDGGIDLETNALSPYDTKDPKILTASIGTFEHTVAFPLDYSEDKQGWPTKALRKRAFELLSEYVLSMSEKIAHNLSFEMLWLSWFFGYQILRLTRWGDTLAMSNTLDGRKGTNGLDEQTAVHFGFNLKKQSPVDVTRPQWWKLYSLKEILRYNAMDTKWTHRLKDVLRPKIEANEAYAFEYKRLVNSSPSLALLQHRGLPVDIDYVKDLMKDYSKQLREVETKLRACPEIELYTRQFGTFEVENSHHVLKLMKEVCKRTEIRREDRDGTTKWTSDEEALALIPADEVPSASLILDHRGLSKIKGTYLLPIVEGKRSSYDWVMHASYNGTGTVSGRLSSIAHNIPKHEHKKVRGFVAASEGKVLMPVDYGQIQFRAMGMLSEDQNLVKYCWTGYDVHKFWAERLIEEYEPVLDRIAKHYYVDRGDDKALLKTLRQEMKNMWVFPQLFGVSLNTCAMSLKIPIEVAEDLDAEFWDEFPGVKRWQGKQIEFFEKHLYIESPNGRRRRGPMSKNEIINTPIQGAEADIVSAAQNALSELAQVEDDYELHPNFNGHDDLTFLLQEANVEAKMPIIVREMLMHRFDWIIVPLLVEVQTGKRWNETKEIGKFYSNDLFNVPNPYAN